MYLYLFLIFVIVFVVLIVWDSMHPKESYCGWTGLTYAEGPLPDPIQEESKSPPFYDQNAARKPLCSYKNYMFPPPMRYGSFPTCPTLEKQYQYWNTAMLSTPQTPYLV